MWLFDRCVWLAGSLCLYRQPIFSQFLAYGEVPTRSERCDLFCSEHLGIDASACTHKARLKPKIALIFAYTISFLLILCVFLLLNIRFPQNWKIIILDVFIKNIFTAKHAKKTKTKQSIQLKTSRYCIDLLLLCCRKNGVRIPDS